MRFRCAMSELTANHEHNACALQSVSHDQSLAFVVHRFCPSLFLLGLSSSITESGTGSWSVRGHRPMSGRCPACGDRSSRVHSRYVRMVTDLPCAARSCSRLWPGALPAMRHPLPNVISRNVSMQSSRSAGQTARLECIVQPGARRRPAANFAKRLITPVSNDTLLCGAAAPEAARDMPLLMRCGVRAVATRSALAPLESLRLSSRFAPVAVMASVLDAADGQKVLYRHG